MKLVVSKDCVASVAFVSWVDAYSVCPSRRIATKKTRLNLISFANGVPNTHERCDAIKRPRDGAPDNNFHMQFSFFKL